MTHTMPPALHHVATHRRTTSLTAARCELGMCGVSGCVGGSYMHRNSGCVPSDLSIFVEERANDRQHTILHPPTCASAHTHTQSARTHMHKYSNIHALIHAYTHSHTRKHTHTRTHTHTHNTTQSPEKVAEASDKALKTLLDLCAPAFEGKPSGTMVS